MKRPQKMLSPVKSKKEKSTKNDPQEWLKFKGTKNGKGKVNQGQKAPAKKSKKASSASPSDDAESFDGSDDDEDDEDIPDDDFSSGEDDQEVTGGQVEAKDSEDEEDSSDDDEDQDDKKDEDPNRTVRFPLTTIASLKIQCPLPIPPKTNHPKKIQQK